MRMLLRAYERLLLPGAAVILLLFATPSYGQSVLSPSAIAHLDSLLMDLDFESIDQYVGSMEESDVQVGRYQRLIESVEQLAEQDREYLKSYTTVRLVEIFDFSTAGYRATELHESFRKLVLAAEYRTAAPYYEAARFFKFLHAREVEVMLEDHYNRARVAYQNLDYPEAEQTLDSVVVFFESKHDRHQSYIDSLLILKGDIFDSQVIVEQQHSMWGRSERVFLRAGIVASVEVVNRKFVGPISVRGLSRTTATTAILEAPGFDAASEFAFGGEGFVYLTQRIVVGGGGSYSKYSYSNESDERLVFMSFESSIVSGYGYSRFVLRPFEGLRPYLKAGAGFRNYAQDSSNVVIITNFSDGTTEREDFHVEKESETKGMYFAGVGFEYVECSECKLVVGAEFNVTKNFGENQFLPSVQPSLRIYLGIQLPK